MATEKRSSQFAIITGLASCLLLIALAEAGLAADSRTADPDYRKWVESHVKKEFVGSEMPTIVGAPPEKIEPVPLKAIITVIEGDDPNPKLNRFAAVSAEGVEITEEGRVSDFLVDSFHYNRGPARGKPLPAEKLTGIDELLRALPDDGGRLPPPNRRILVEAKREGKITARVYDRANAPEALWDLLRIVVGGEGLGGSYVPEFKPRSEIAARGYDNSGFLSVSPDGKKLLFASGNHSLQFWDPVAHELLEERADLAGKSIAFSPDGSLAVIGGRGCQIVDTRTWWGGTIRAGTSYTQFTPDGRYAWFYIRKRPIEIYDAHSWTRVERLPDAPEEALARYSLSPDGRRAIAESMSGAVFLWAPAEHREIARLRDDAYITATAFSPGQTLLAIATESTISGNYWNSARIEVWETENGKKKENLRPYESRSEPNTGMKWLLWSPDGAWLLLGGGSGVNVFNVKTGRHRGQLRVDERVIGMSLLSGGNELAVGSADRKIKFWDFKDVLKQIREFEQSVEGNQPAP